MAWSQQELPLTFGEIESGAMPEPGHPASTRIDSAIMFYLNQMESHRNAVSRPEWILVDGIAASPGRYEGYARVIRGPSDFERLKKGDVLVVRSTSPAYNLLLPIIGAVVTDRGGSLCHSAIIAREFGIPAVVGTNLGTTLIPDGARVLVDGDRGFVAVQS
jgi:pyruvate,water dikinase